jgi:hypothetical protein
MISTTFISKKNLDMSFNIATEKKNNFLNMKSMKVIGYKNFGKIKRAIEKKYNEFKGWKVFQS